MNEIIENNNKYLMENKTESLVNDIIEEDDIERTKQLLNLFNVNIAKKNTLRVMKVDQLLDKVTDEALKRVEERPDEIANKDLLNYATVAQNQIDKSMQIIKSVNEAPAIQLNQQNIVNINNIGQELSKESRDRVLSVVEQILNNDVVDVETKK